MIAQMDSVGIGSLVMYAVCSTIAYPISFVALHLGIAAITNFNNPSRTVRVVVHTLSAIITIAIVVGILYGFQDSVEH